jgi:hypothetical protein
MVLPAPEAAVHAEPAEATQVQVTVVTLAGTVSVTVPVTAYALLLLTTMV